MNILFLGAPGVGKGTQAKVVSERFNIPIISMGDMLREMIKIDEKLKEKVVPYMQAGKLVPDKIVGEILKKRVLKKDCENGFILDGYPRNELQDKQLEENRILIDKAVEIVVSDEIIIERLTGRRICPSCGRIFHVKFKKPQRDGVCDFCESSLEIRFDDKEETIKKRLRVFHEETEKLRKCYKQKGKYFFVDGEKSPIEVSEAIFKVVEGD